MADIQKHFRNFDDAIRFDRDHEIATLAEKRERVLRRLSEGIARQRKEGKTIPSYEPFNQGSYPMKLGVKPVDGDFDIDVGLRFALSTADYRDPGVVKTWVYEAVKNHTKDVEIRRGCVTVQYQEKGEDAYHVDLVCYSSKEKNADGKDYIAKGKPGNCLWEPSDPQALEAVLFTDTRTGQKRAGEDLDQYRRVIRALKRWKDVHFAGYKRKGPKGIALTVAAYRWFEVSKTTDGSTQTVRYDDLEALRSLVHRMVSSFLPTWSAQANKHLPRLRVELPIPPGSDLCDNMSDAGMAAFKERLEKLLDALKAAQADTDATAACKRLREHFGPDFPVP